MTQEQITRRADHCRAIGAHGGRVTADRYGRFHMAAIGKAGAQVTIQRHGVAYFQGLMTRKGWEGVRPASCPSFDLALGRVLAAATCE